MPPRHQSLVHLAAPIAANAFAAPIPAAALAAPIPAAAFAAPIPAAAAFAAPIPAAAAFAAPIAAADAFDAALIAADAFAAPIAAARAFAASFADVVQAVHDVRDRRVPDRHLPVHFRMSSDKNLVWKDSCLATISFDENLVFENLGKNVNLPKTPKVSFFSAQV